MIENTLKEMREGLPFLIAAHRGTNAASITQNTALAAKVALMEGADIVEHDLARSKDGVYYAFHTGHEKDVFGTKFDFSALTSNEIDQLRCLNSVGNPLHHGPERMDVLLQSLKEKHCLINIDRTWFCGLEDGLTYLETFDMADQLIIKTPIEKQYLDVIQRHPCLFMAIMTDAAQLDEILPLKDRLNLVAVECQWHEEGNPLSTKAFTDRLHQEGLLAWANSLHLSDDWSINSFWDDTRSIEKGPDAGWGKLYKAGFDVIQTDWPNLLSAWRKELMHA